MRHRSGLVAFALAFSMGPAASRANPLTMFGAGARGASMGGAQTAAARDASANFYNPALLATLSELEIDLGYHMAVPNLRLNDRDLGVDLGRGTLISLAMPGEVAGLRVGVGVSSYLPDQQLMRIRSLSEQQPRFALYDNRAQRLFMGVHLGVAIGDKLSVGGGVGYLTATSGEVSLLGRVGFPDANDSDLRIDMDVDVSTLAYPNLGIAYQLRPWLRVGASYRGGVQPVTDLAVNIEGDIGAENRDPIVEDAAIHLRSISLSHFQPAELSLGIDARLSSRLGFAADLSWHRWSAFENPAALLETELDLGQFNEFFDTPPVLELSPVSFHDILIPRLGVEWLAREGDKFEVHGRAGYSYEPSPAPEQIGLANFVDNDKHTASLGAGLTLRDVSSILLQPVSLDASFALTSLQERQHRKLSPIDPVGDYRSDGSVWQFLTTSRVRF